MSIQPSPCSSIREIKALAKKIKKSSTNSGLPHFWYLNAAAERSGFENFNHAISHFKSQPQADAWVNVRCRFRWKDSTHRDLAGHLQVEVTPLRGLSQQDLERIVFVIPEFWTGQDSTLLDREHFRVDSAYFHRVTDAEHAVYSQRVRRYVLSFHLLNSRWQASIFDYGTTLSHSEMELEIESALVAHINATVRSYQEGELEKTRVLSPDLHENMSELMSFSEQQAATLLWRE